MMQQPLLTLLVPVANLLLHGVPHFRVVVEGSVGRVEPQVGTAVLRGVGGGATLGSACLGFEFGGDRIEIGVVVGDGGCEGGETPDDKESGESSSEEEATVGEEYGGFVSVTVSRLCHGSVVVMMRGVR